jgi:hypothetical protein
MNNKLYCTFVKTEQVDNHIEYLTDNYDILYNKIFVLETKNRDYDRFILTYNIDSVNLKEDAFFENTINVHRKKETNTLYTINAINVVSLEENGRIDPSYRIDWEKYKNCLLLSKNNRLINISTSLNRIVEF